MKKTYNLILNIFFNGNVIVCLKDVGRLSYAAQRLLWYSGKAIALIETNGILRPSFIEGLAQLNIFRVPR